MPVPRVRERLAYRFERLLDDRVLRNGECRELSPFAPLQRRALAGLLGEVPAGRP